MHCRACLLPDQHCEMAANKIPASADQCLAHKAIPYCVAIESLRCVNKCPNLKTYIYIIGLSLRTDQLCLKV